MTYWWPTAFKQWGAGELSAIQRVLASDKLTMGEEVAAFEREFADYHQMKHGIMVNSGSSANLVAVATLFAKEDKPLQRGDRVIVPAVAWSTTYSPLVQYGLDLMLADIDDTWNAHGVLLDLQKKPPRLIIGCSILGNPAYLQSWKQMAETLDNCYFIEDNCESLGALGRDKPGPYRKCCGTFGLLNTFSFFWSHQLSAIEGGMILTNDDEFADLCRRLRAHGWDRDIVRPNSFDEEYRFTHFGYNLRPLELHAAIARDQLKKLEIFRKQRQQNYNNMVTWCQDLPVKFQKLNGIVSPFGIPFHVKDRETRARLVDHLRNNGVDCRLPTGGSFRRHPYAKQWADQETLEADKLHDTGMFIGNPPWPCEEELLKIVRLMEGVLR